MKYYLLFLILILITCSLLSNSLILKDEIVKTTLFNINKVISSKEDTNHQKKINLNEVIVFSSSKKKQRYIKIPYIVSKINKKEIDFFQPQNTGDLLTISNGVFLQKSQQGGGSPMIRGFAANRLLYSIDGIRMNTAIFRGGNLHNIISIDPMSISSTEIFYGTNTVIYGSDAIGGVISIKTINPKNTNNDTLITKGNAYLQYASANNKQGIHADFSIQKKKIASLTSISLTKFGDMKMGHDGPDDYLQKINLENSDNKDIIKRNAHPEIQKNIGYNQTNLMQKFLFKINKKISLQLNSHYSITSNFNRYDRLTRTKNNQPVYGEWYYGPQIWNLNSIEFSYKKTQKLLFDELSLKLAHQYFEESRNTRRFNDNNLIKRKEKVNALSLNIDFSKKINNLSFYYGFEYIANFIRSQALINNLLTDSSYKTSTRYPNSEWYSLGSYIDSYWNLNKDITLSGGLRYNLTKSKALFNNDFYNFPFSQANNTNSAITGTLGISYSFSKNSVLKSNFSTGFRSPNIDDIGKIFDSGNGIIVVPNPLINPEYVYNFDVSLNKIFSNIFRLEITGFYSILDQALIRAKGQFNGKDSIFYDGEFSQVQSIQNASQIHVYGIQGFATLYLSSSFKLSASLNYQKGFQQNKGEDRKPTSQIAPLFGNLKVTYTNNKLTAQLYGLYNGEISYDNLSDSERNKTNIYAKNTNQNPYSPSWYTLNFKTQYKTSKNLDIGIGIENITNQRYRPYKSGISALGRNITVNVLYHF